MPAKTNPPRALDDWIKVVTHRIVAHFHPLQIILFGSHARNEATDDSDIDLLVVFSEVSSKRQLTIAIRDILVDLPIAKDIVVTTPQEIAEYGHLVGTVLKPALEDGKLLYEQTANP